jgi:hypothetical protein
MTTNEIILAARRKMLEETTDLISDESALLYANQSYLDLQKRTFTNDQLLTANVTLTDGSGSLPLDFGTLYSDALDVSGNVFAEMNLADFDRAKIDGVNAVAISGSDLLVSPITTNLLTIRYYPIYDELSVAQNPEINAYLHECLIYGVLYRAYEDLQDEELADFYKKKYEAMVLEKTSHISNYEEANQRGGQLFNGISIL